MKQNKKFPRMYAIYYKSGKKFQPIDAMRIEWVFKDAKILAKELNKVTKTKNFVAVEVGFFFP